MKTTLRTMYNSSSLEKMNLLCYYETPSIGSDLSSLFNGWLPLCWISKPSCFVYPTNQSKVIKIKDKNPLETLEKTSYISCKGSVC